MKRQQAIDAAMKVAWLYQIRRPQDPRVAMALETARAAVAADNAGQRIDRKALYAAQVAANTAASEISGDAAASYAAIAAGATCILSSTSALAIAQSRSKAALDCAP